MSWLSDRKIVVPIDFSDESKMAVDVALELSPSAASVSVIHVAANLNMISPEAVWIDVSDESRREALMKSFREEFAGPKYGGLKFGVLFGDPGHEIAKFARDTGAGLIVLPSTGRTGLTHLLIGSVAERVVRFAHCPVLVLRK